MNTKRMRGAAFGVALVGLLILAPRAAGAHCDTMSGPVVAAARHALEGGNVNLALIWVRPQDEAAVRREFSRARAARGGSKGAAEMRFFETLVRLHRAGEGEPFTGIKPAGTDLGPAIPAADRALESGSATEVQRIVEEAVRAGIRTRFEEALGRRRYKPDDLTAGRAFVKAYVEYVHYVETIHGAATAPVHPERGEVQGHGAPGSSSR